MDNRNNYAEFVSDIYSVVLEIMPDSSKGLLTFAAGEISRNEISDFAFLRNEKALYFYSVLLSNYEKFHIDPSQVVLHRSLIFRDELLIQHSCYAKNVHRWLNGQVPRKRRCRADFTVLTYCWITAFGSDRKNEPKYVLAREKTRLICQHILTETEYDTSLSMLELIWLASNYAYFPQGFSSQKNT